MSLFEFTLAKKAQKKIVAFVSTAGVTLTTKSTQLASIGSTSELPIIPWMVIALLVLASPMAVNSSRANSADPLIGEPEGLEKAKTVAVPICSIMLFQLHQSEVTIFEPRSILVSAITDEL